MSDNLKWMNAVGFVVLAASIAYGVWSFMNLNARLDRLIEQQAETSSH